MKKSISTALLMTLLFSLADLVHASGVNHGKRAGLKVSRKFVSDELIVKFKSGASSRSKRDLMSRMRADMIKQLDAKGTTHLKLNGFKSVEEAIQDYKQDPDVEYVQPNYIYRLAAIPNDPSYGQMWGFKNTGQTVAGASYSTNNPGTAGRDMNLELAWNHVTNCSSVVVAVIDSGVNYNHQDLASNMWTGAVNHGYDFSDNDNDPMDLNGHGTHVAGTIAAAGNNGLGTAGVCWQAKIMAVRVTDSLGQATTSQLVDGINYAVANGAKVINMSLAGASADQAEINAINNASNAGVVMVAAAGNEGVNNDAAGGGNHSYPCDLTASNMVCVAALDQNYALASFSNYGSTSVDVGAPGTNILSSLAGTRSTLSEDFNTAGALDWTASTTTSGGWTYGNKTFGTSGGGTVTLPVLFNPSNWNGTSNRYNNSTNDKAYKTFNLSGVNAAYVNFLTFYDTEAGHDFFNIAYKSTGGDPFAGGTLLEQIDGSSDGFAVELLYDLASCRTANCSLGFQLTSDATVNGFGAAVLDLTISLLTLNNTSYYADTGTSMATPHVAGLAALLFAYNPNFTAADVVNAIKNGGVATASLSGKTTTGKAADAMGSLAYIRAPTGITFALE